MNFSLKNNYQSYLFMFLITLGLGLFNLFYGEIIPVGNGFGWDGVYYAEMVKSFDGSFESLHLNNYYAHRFLPSLIVYWLMEISQIPITDLNIIKSFEFVNLIFILMSTVIWNKISDHFTLSVSARWIGFFALFVNFFISKQAFYYPVLTDVTAFFLGLLLLFFNLKKKLIPLVAITFFGSFVWTGFGLYGALLIFFFSSEDYPRYLKFHHFDVSKKLNCLFKLWKKIVFICIVTLITVKIYNELNSSHDFRKLTGFLVALPSLGLSLLALVALLGSKNFVKEILHLCLRRLFSFYSVLALCVFLIPHFIAQLITTASSSFPPSLHLTSQFFKWILIEPYYRGKVLLPFIAQIHYFGPAFVLFFLCWSGFSQHARNLGLGLIGVVFLALFFILPSEGRFIIPAWPFLVLPLILHLEDQNKAKPIFFVFSLMSLVFAQFWLKLNFEGWPGPGHEYDGFNTFPKQLYLYHYGPWMWWGAYLISLPVIYLIYRILKSHLFSNKQIKKT